MSKIGDKQTKAGRCRTTGSGKNRILDTGRSDAISGKGPFWERAHAIPCNYMQFHAKPMHTGDDHGVEKS